MLSQEEQMQDLDTTKLCLSCGFCCQGLIFGRAALRSDELATAVQYGLPYFTISKRDYGLRYHAIHIKTTDASSTQTVPMPAEDIDAIC
jgi:hypothetical protein